MSLLLLASNLLERVGIRQRTGVLPAAPAAPPNTDSPRQIRDRMRVEIRSRGGRPEEIQSITGDCDQQVATQLKDYTQWLASH